MSPYNKIMIGERNGKRAVIAVAPTKNPRHPRYFVRCDCGSVKDITGGQFRLKPNCYDCAKIGQPRKYGGRHSDDTRLYKIWIGMRRRCRLHTGSERNKRWADRGITVCRAWEESFIEFEKWALAAGYRPGLSIDRINNDGNYEPSNISLSL